MLEDLQNDQSQNNSLPLSLSLLIASMVIGTCGEKQSSNRSVHDDHRTHIFILWLHIDYL